MNEINKHDLVPLLKKTIKDEGLKEMADDILEYIATVSSCEIRSSLNILEIANMLDQEDLNLNNVSNLIGKKALQIHEEGEYYYDCASAMIKSIRGSDPDAALYYLARLL
jgi:putative ATPase